VDDWSAIAAAGAFVVGLAAGAILTVRLTRAVWDSAFRARRRAEDDADT